jgi:anti-sigma-K factor RskA
MSQPPPPFSEQDRAELVAYLDGELTGEAARAMEARIALEPAVRAEADALKRTWDLLDFLPRPEPSPSFTARTLSRLGPLSRSSATAGLRRPLWRRLAFGGGWAAAVVAAALGGYFGYHRLVPREPGEEELVRDLRLIENKRQYELIEDVELFKGLEQPDLFGEESSGS